MVLNEETRHQRRQVDRLGIILYMNPIFHRHISVMDRLNKVNGFIYLLTEYKTDNINFKNCENIKAELLAGFPLSDWIEPFIGQGME